MKKFFLNYYNYRLQQLVKAQKRLQRYVYLMHDNDSIECSGLKLNVVLQELLLQIYVSLLPKKWFKE